MLKPIGETTVSNEILDNVLRGGDLLKIRGLWRQPEPTATTPPPSLIQRAPKRSQSPQPQAQCNTQTCRATQSVLENKKNPNVCTNLPPPPPLLKRSKDGTYIEECSTITKISDTTTITTVHESQELEMDAAEYLVIKEEPKDFEDGETNEDFDPGYDEIIPASNTFISDENITEEGEVLNPNNGDSIHSCKNGSGSEDNGGGETLYTPLTCELCSETFTLPRDWVRHVETYHGDQSNSHSTNNNHCGAKRLKRASTQKVSIFFCNFKINFFNKIDRVTIGRWRNIYAISMRFVSKIIHDPTRLGTSHSKLPHRLRISNVQ